MKIGYARVSTRDQNLDLQLDALNAAGCEKIFSEKISGTKKERPELDKMMALLRRGDEVIVYKLDRLGRSLKHLVELIEELKEKGVSFFSLTDSIRADDSAMGKMMLNIFAAFAQFERDLISERTRAGLAAARKQGRKGGRPKGLSKKNNAKMKSVKRLHQAGTPMIDICNMLEIPRATAYRYLDYEEQESVSKTR